MINDHKKLEELMYISLLGKFSYRFVRDGKTYVGFTSSNLFKNLEAKPVYVTSLKTDSDFVSLKRICAFEKKILPEDLVDEENLNYVARMKNFLDEKYEKADNEQKAEILDNFKTNLLKLKEENVISLTEARISISYVCKHIEKEEKEIKLN